MYSTVTLEILALIRPVLHLHEAAHTLVHVHNHGQSDFVCSHMARHSTWSENYQQDDSLRWVHPNNPQATRATTVLE